MLASRGMMGQASKWWLNRRNLIVLYRGQDIAAVPILSPMARTQGVAASEALLARLRAAGMSDIEIATESARKHIAALPPYAPNGLAGLQAGAVGIPSTALPGIAANFDENGVIYILRLSKNSVVRPVPWQSLVQEDEYTIFNQVPAGSIVKVIPAKHVAPLMVNEHGLLTPGR